MSTSDAPRRTTVLPNRRRSNWGNPVARLLQYGPLALAAAALITGLIFGLVIGWVLWPVSWTSAWPGDLNAEAKAHYLAAVAESYVYYGDDEAAETARNRLFDLNDDLAAEIQAAQEYFANNPQRNSRIYITNLELLAQRLNVESSGAGFEPAAPGDAPSAAPAETPSATRSIFNWTLAVIAALVLIGGGIYALTRFARSRKPEPDGFYEEEFDEDDEGYDEYDDLADTPTFTPVQQFAPQPASAETRSGYGSRLADDYDFDEESDDSRVVYKPARPVDELDEERDEAVDHPLDEIGLDDYDSDEEDDPPTPRVSTFTAPSALPTPDAPPTNTTSWPEAAVAAPPPAASGRSQRPAPSLAGKTLGTFTAHYQVGLIDYDQSFNIVDPESGRYIGECGMGVNMKNGILQNNPEHVIALDVWLFDKKTDKSLTNQTRVLLSEYVIDNKLDQAFTRERPNDPTPLVAQPGLNFQLRGQHLVLDCHIVEASYMRNGQASGIFQSIRIDMTVRLKES